MQAFMTLLLMILFFSLVLPAVAMAQGLPSFLSGDSLMTYLLIALAVVEVAKRVTAIIPGVRDDEFVSVIDGLLRKVVDFIAGKTGKPSDPSLVKRE